VKKLELLKIVIPNKFLDGAIIAKFPPSWRDYTITLKHKRINISVSNMFDSLDVEEKAQAKDEQYKGVEG
jgi:hypothetical protein